MDVAIHCKFTDQELVALEQHRAGGGNPAAAFYETLKVENCGEKVSTLRNCFEKLKLTKAVEVLKDCEPCEILGDISPLHIDKLSQETTFSIRVQSKNWKHVAQHFNKDLARFAPAIRQGHSFSPTEEFFRIIGRKYLNDINIGLFLDCVITAKNNEAKNEIKDQIKELARKLL